MARHLVIDSMNGFHGVSQIEAVVQLCAFCAEGRDGRFAFDSPFLNPEKDHLGVFWALKKLQAVLMMIFIDWFLIGCQNVHVQAFRNAVSMHALPLSRCLISR